VRRDAPTIRPAVVRLRKLPAPDALDLSLAADYLCLVADAGSRLTPELCHRLEALGLKPVVLQMAVAPDVEPTTDNLKTVRASGLDEASIQAALSTVLERYGPVGSLIYLHPHLNGAEEEAAFSTHDQVMVRAAFLMAKFLQPSLSASATEAWGGFMTVTRLDGALGVDDDWGFGVGGGLPGLVKTLRLEWPDVACRAVDIAPDLDPEGAVDAIVSELRDPDRSIVEVGCSSAGRVTLEAAWETETMGVGEK
jgi:hypothetical protein